MSFVGGIAVAGATSGDVQGGELLLAFAALSGGDPRALHVSSAIEDLGATLPVNATDRAFMVHIIL